AHFTHFEFRPDLRQALCHRIVTTAGNEAFKPNAKSCILILYLDSRLGFCRAGILGLNAFGAVGAQHHAETEWQRSCYGTLIHVQHLLEQHCESH
ncbi:MAG: hypothetical protein ACPGYL_06540, partial [Rhodospirillaceae bacterium]